ncbi:hypothetical protein DAT561_p0022 (plasmid) [Melissococcus plutonius]|uniref:Uncharacterized protein n=1 Tax=Melissococcus plutonius TaxID=33970 RepID=A0A2Z5Y4X4_9ENTE|nr:hypothetical protein DAT561_p0022 [Melissococcus plutonius]
MSSLVSKAYHSIIIYDTIIASFFVVCYSRTPIHGWLFLFNFYQKILAINYF